MDDPSQDDTLPYNIRPRKLDDNQMQQTVAGTGNEKEKVGEKLEVDKRETALMVAAKNGVMEIVEKILVQKPTAIHETNSEHQNILHMAVKYRQPHVFEFLRKRYEDKLWDNLIGSVDKDDNTVLHLAAKLSKYKPWHIPGAAMQMQWEIKWFLVCIYLCMYVSQYICYQPRLVSLVRSRLVTHKVMSSIVVVM